MVEELLNVMDVNIFRHFKVVEKLIGVEMIH
jgi:hypothetical protein